MKKEMMEKAIEEVKKVENDGKLGRIYDEFFSAIIDFDIDGGAKAMREMYEAFSAETFAVLGWYLDKVSHRFEENVMNDDSHGVMDKLEKVAEIVEELEDED